ncbi:hypothetical protein JCM11641_000920 [Rhodosporidiobolus odoratus]
MHIVNLPKLLLHRSGSSPSSFSSTFTLLTVTAVFTLPSTRRLPSLAYRPVITIARLRHRLPLALSALVALLLVAYLVSGHLGTSTLSLPSTALAAVEHLRTQHPNFDFDAHLIAQEGHVGHDVEQEQNGDAGDVHDDEAGEDHEGEDDQHEAEEDREASEGRERRKGHAGNGTLARSFLPFSCESCTSTSPEPSDGRTCAKYLSPDPSPFSISASPLHPAILDHSVLFPGTGQDVRRILKRAMKSSLYGMKRSREGKEGDSQKWEDEEPFRVLVLGGSVSNCRGVDANTACWHSHVLRWFQQSFPMEGDRYLVPNTPSLLFPSPDSAHLPLRSSRFRQRRKRADLPSAESDASPFISYSKPSSLASPSLPAAGTTQLTSAPLIPVFKSNARPSPLRKRAVSPKKTKKKKPRKVRTGSRQRPSSKLINGSKSATGSAFFAYCFEEEMTLRRKNVDWGKGPDLVIVESGVNDVWPGGEQATRDFERLLRRLRSLPSKPAVIALEAASLLLASTTGATANAEYTHLPAAHFYDVPILSAKQALFGPNPGLLPSSASSAPLRIEDLFLPDLHHPNERGHELLADILLSYLEQQACLAQSEVIADANKRIRASSSSASTESAPGGSLPIVSVLGQNEVDPALDLPRRKEEAARPLPARSLFSPFPHGKTATTEKVWELPETRCIQVGNSQTKVGPIRNSGWTKLAWARDKQYLVADKPGSSVTYRIEVGKGGSILADWLHSRQYELGDVSVYLDNDRKRAVTLAGHWDLGWSIGVPTEIFSGVPPGSREITFEILPPSQSSHPSKKTNFRLIGLVAT